MSEKGTHTVVAALIGEGEARTGKEIIKLCA
jgi:hypothetical protein